MMQTLELKLKQASAVLGISSKELQNLVQFGVLRPRRRARVCFFDANVLLQAKVAGYLKDSLGTSTQYLVLAQLLTRLDQAIDKALTEDIYTDEINS